MAKETINNGEGGLSVRNKLNSMFDELYVLEKKHVFTRFVIRICESALKIEREIDTHFRDFGRMSNYAPEDGHHNDWNYKGFRFEIFENKILKYDGVLSGFSGLTSKIQEVCALNVQGGNTLPIEVEVSLNVSLPPIVKAYPYNRSFDYIRGVDLNPTNRRLPINRAVQLGGYFDLWQALSYQYTIDVPTEGGEYNPNVIWMTKSRNGFSRHFRNGQYVSLSSGINPVDNGRVFWRPSDRQYISILEVPAGASSHAKACNTSCFYVGNDPELLDEVISVGDWFLTQKYYINKSLVKFTLFETQDLNGNLCYCIVAKPDDYDTFRIEYPRIAGGALYAYLTTDNSVPIVRKMKAENAPNIRDYAVYGNTVLVNVYKDDILRPNMMLNVAGKKSPKRENIRDLQFFYTDGLGNMSALSTFKIYIDTKKTGSKYMLNLKQA